MRGFRGADFFLSNGYPSKIEFDGRFYATVWHAFSAACANNEGERFAAATAPTPAVAAALGLMFQGPLAFRSETAKETMRGLLRQKFEAYPELASKLVNTGTQQLISEEPPGDQWWGSHNGRGENVLGELLMEERKFFRDRVKDATKVSGEAPPRLPH